MSEGAYAYYSAPYCDGCYWYVDDPNGVRYVWTGTEWADAATYFANTPQPEVTYGAPYSDGSYWYVEDSNGSQYVWDGTGWADAASYDPSTYPVSDGTQQSEVTYSEPFQLMDVWFVNDSNGTYYAYTDAGWEERSPSQMDTAVELAELWRESQERIANIWLKPDPDEDSDGTSDNLDVKPYDSDIQDSGDLDDDFDGTTNSSDPDDFDSDIETTGDLYDPSNP